ncbi:MAG TPA: lipid A deacylase LpxR family protein, partial [Longimicrobium sp.]|nr:lipid A deacylase LpxR family protein [Longimicrobium sp.]
VTGPPSLAEPVQTGLHRLAGYRPPLGWAHQLPFEPGIVLRYREARTWTAEGDRLAASASSRWGAAAGNVWTGADAGIRLAAGWRTLPDGSMASGDADRPGVYLFSGVRQEWVLRNLFLDGGTFRDTHCVDKRPLVTEGEIGIGTRVRRVEVQYRAVFRGREYRTQDEPHRYGSITLTLIPRTGG